MFEMAWSWTRWPWHHVVIKTFLQQQMKVWSFGLALWLETQYASPGFTKPGENSIRCSNEEVSFLQWPRNDSAWSIQHYILDLWSNLGGTLVGYSIRPIWTLCTSGTGYLDKILEPFMVPAYLTLYYLKTWFQWTPQVTKTVNWTTNTEAIDHFRLQRIKSQSSARTYYSQLPNGQNHYDSLTTD
jgi:hypothetical protein